MLGQDAPVLLVHADAVADLAGVAEGVADDGAEVGDLAEAVAAQFQRVGVLAHEVFAGVEVVLPGPDRRRVAVRDHHFGDGRAVDDGPQAVAVLEGEVVQHHALADVEADVDAPLFPLDVVAAGDREAGPVRLGDVDGLLRGAQRAGELRIGVVAVLGGNRDGAGVQHLGHFLADDVDVGHEPVHRVRPGAVLREVLHEGQPAQDPAALLLRVLEDAGGQRGNADLADVQAAVGQGLEPPLVRGQELLRRPRTPPPGPAARRSPRCPARRRRPPCRWRPRRSRRAGRPPETSCRKTRNRRSSAPGRRVPGGVQQAEVGDALCPRPAVPRRAGCPGPR